MMRAERAESLRRALRGAGWICLVGATVYAVWWFAWTVRASANPVAIHDQWWIFRASEEPVRAWFSARNGHVLFFPRFLYVLDVRAAHGTGYLLTCAAVLGEVALAALVLWLLRQGGASGSDLLLTGACTAPIAFGAIDFSNYLYGFMVHWWLSMVGFVGAVAAVAGMARSDRRRPWVLAAAAVAGAVVAALSMASGFLAFAAVAALALLALPRTASRWVLAAMACAGAALYAAVYLWGQPSSPHGGTPHLADGVGFSAMFVGAPLAEALFAGLRLGGHLAADARAALLAGSARGIGIAGLAITAWLGASALWRAREPARAPLMALCSVQVWVIVSSLGVYATRMALGSGQAMARQYWPLATLFWITVPAGAALALRGARPWSRALVSGALLLLTAGLLLSQPRFLRWSRGIRDDQYRSAVMLASGVSDRQLLELTFHPDHTEEDRWRDVAWLEVRHAGPFSEPWLDRLGTRLEARAPGPDHARCPEAAVGAPVRVDAGAHSGWRLSGWVTSGHGRRASSRLVLVDASSTVVGFGWIAATWPIPPGTPTTLPGPASGWTAYASGAAAGTVTVYEDLGLAGPCPLALVDLPAPAR